MRSDGNSFNYFSKNELTKLANFVQFKRMPMFCLEDWGAGPPARRPPWLRHWPGNRSWS